jgi:hypothetical protein
VSGLSQAGECSCGHSCSCSCGYDHVKISCCRIPPAPCHCCHTVACCAVPERSQVGLAAFDTAVHFFAVKGGEAQPQLLVMSDVNDVFAPGGESAGYCFVQGQPCYA